MDQIHQDRMVTLLLCSDLGLTEDMKKRFKPYTTPQWNKLMDAVIHSSLEKPAGLLLANKEIFEQELKLGDEEIERLSFLLKRGGNLSIEIEGLESKGVHVITRSEKNYPQKLKIKLKKYAPPVIYYCGNLDLVNETGVAIVGSRDVDEKGKLFTEKLARECATDNLTVVSGGARGVDSIAEKTALAGGGYVVSVVPDSLIRRIKDKEVRNEILEDKLLLISSVNPAARFSVYSAMDRNKYIYALSEYAVVVASKVNSGGTWAGAQENLKKNLAPLFVRTGDKIPAGNKKLIELGGKELDISLLDNSRISLKEWFENNAKDNPDKDAYYQPNLYELNEDKQNITSVREE